MSKLLITRRAFLLQSGALLAVASASCQPSVQAPTPAVGQAPAGTPSSAGKSTKPANMRFYTVNEPVDAGQLNDMLGKTPIPSKKYRIGVLFKTLNNEYWMDMKDGVDAAAKKYGVQVDLQAGKDESDLTGQLSMAESMLQNNYDAYVMCPQTGSNLTPFFDKVQKQPVPLIIMDENADPPVPTAVWIGGNYYRDGVRAGEYLGKVLTEPSEVAHIEGMGGSAGSRDRARGLKETLAKFPNIKLVASQPGDWDRLKAMNIATALMTAFPNLKAIHASNDTMALGVVEAVKAAGKLGKIIILGNDGTPGALDSIRAGDMQGTVVSFPYIKGLNGVELAIRMLEGVEVPSKSYSWAPWATKENLDDLLKQKDQMLS